MGLSQRLISKCSFLYGDCILLGPSGCRRHAGTVHRDPCFSIRIDRCDLPLPGLCSQVGVISPCLPYLGVRLDGGNRSPVTVGGRSHGPIDRSSQGLASQGQKLPRQPSWASKPSVAGFETLRPLSFASMIDRLICCLLLHAVHLRLRRGSEK